jgi:alkylation response protein AidB-like acyl-CoA dehydrogenase
VSPISGTPAIYQLGEEHEGLREAVRSLAAKEIEPHAAEVDELERYPAEAREALTRSGFHAVHIPGQYGGKAPTGWQPAS